MFSFHPSFASVKRMLTRTLSFATLAFTILSCGLLESDRGHGYSFHEAIDQSDRIGFVSLHGFSALAKAYAKQQNMQKLVYVDVATDEFDLDAKSQQEPGPVKLIITYPFWQTKSFLILSTILGIVGVASFSFMQVRIRDAYKLKTQVEVVVQERNAMIETLTKSLDMRNKSLQSVEKDCAALEKDLVLHREKIKLAVGAKDSFLSTLSRGVRTPLNGLLGSLVLLRETQLNDEQREYIETVRKCGDQLLSVTTDIIDFSIIESGKIELAVEAFALQTSIEDVLDVFGSMAAENDVDLVYSIGSDVPLQIISDNLRLKQVLITLVGTAMKFVKEREDILVDVRHLETAGDECVLGFEIRDTGIGIPYEDAIALLESFSKIDYSITTKYGGTGLGFSNCENLVKLMGGSILMESNRGKGTTFSFTIKVKQAQSGSRVQETSELDGLEGKRVLVVDNNANCRKMLKSQIALWKLVPAMASSGLAALKILSGTQEFDIVMVDLQMPEFDGIQFAQAVRKSHPLLPIILLGPHGSQYGKSNANLFSSVITKPLKRELLYKHLQNGLRKQNTPLPVEENEKEKLSNDFSREYPLRILIAEDNLINQKLSERVLGKLGYKPEIVPNGAEALEGIKQKQYDLILMDVEMPVMNGLEATMLVRQRGNFQPIIVAMTANVMEGDRNQCLASGMDDYISKPVQITELVNILKKCSTRSVSYPARKSPVMSFEKPKTV